MSWIATLERAHNVTPQQPQKSTKQLLQTVDPPGYTPVRKAVKSGTSQTHGAGGSTMTGHDRATILLKKAWDMALAPWKSLPMSCVMTYFSGSSIQIFSVMMTYSLFSGPLTILLSSPTKPFDVLRDQQGTASGEEKDRRREGGEGSKEGDTLWMQKLVFVVGQLACLVLGVVKLQYMGLLPTATSDWLAWETYTPDDTLVYVA